MQENFNVNVNVKQNHGHDSYHEYIKIPTNLSSISKLRLQLISVPFAHLKTNETNSNVGTNLV